MPRAQDSETETSAPNREDRQQNWSTEPRPARRVRTASVPGPPPAVPSGSSSAARNRPRRQNRPAGDGRPVAERRSHPSTTLLLPARLKRWDSTRQEARYLRSERPDREGEPAEPQEGRIQPPAPAPPPPRSCRTRSRETEPGSRAPGSRTRSPASTQAPASRESRNSAINGCTRCQPSPLYSSRACAWSRSRLTLSLTTGAARCRRWISSSRS